MESSFASHRPAQHRVARRLLGNQRGVALVVALLISAIILATAMGVLFFVGESSKISGAGRGYATAAEAADGAIHLMRDTVDQVMWGEPVDPTYITDSGGCLGSALLAEGTACTVTLNLPGVTGTNFEAEVTVERLYSQTMPGSRLEFAKGAGGSGGTAIFFRIKTKVEGKSSGPENTTSEISALYRFVG